MADIDGAVKPTDNTGLTTDPDDVSRADALRTAAYMKNLPALKEQIAAGVDVNAADTRGWTALLVAPSRSRATR